MKNLHGDIFVSIACYRDPEVIPTVKDAYEKARFKENIIFGIYAQMNESDEKIEIDFVDERQVRLMVVSNERARGPAYARYVIYKKLYRNELYYLQIDSHTRFVEGWDLRLVDMLEKLNMNSVISTYPVGYQLNSNVLPNMKNVNVLKYKGMREGVPVLRSVGERLEEPRRNYFWAAGYSFCYGAIFKIVPFDPNLKNLFWGEEFLMSLRFFTHNIKVYTPDENIVFTLWARDYRHTFWELKPIIGEKFKIYGFLSFLRLCEICKLCDVGIFKDKISKNLEKYGIGQRRTVEEFYERVGIDYKKTDYKQIISNFYFSLKIE